MFWWETDRNHLGYVIENILHRSPPTPHPHVLHDGSDCTCIHSPSSFPLIHLLWDLWPSETNLHTHLLTPSQLLRSSHLIPLFIPYNKVSSHHEILSGVNIDGWLLTDQQVLLHLGERSTGSFLLPTVAMWVQRHTFEVGVGGGVAYLCYWSACRSINENMLLAGNETKSFRCLHVRPEKFLRGKKRNNNLTWLLLQQADKSVKMQRVTTLWHFFV